MSLNNSSAKKRREVTEKVRTIKARQEKWMNERCAEKDHSKDNFYDHQETDLSTPKSIASPAGLHYNPAQYESRPMSSSDFNLKADEIISRVKSQLTVGTGSFQDEAFSTLGSADRNSTAHICHNCEKLMVSPTHSPMMLIPCGHSFCRKCCNDIDFCYICSTEVSSQTSNVMLEQVIVSTTTKQLPSKKPVPGRDTYEDSRQNFMVRKEALHEERCNIEETIETIIHQDIQDEKTQIERIERKEKKILQQISQLQKEMAVLQSHKAEYRENIKVHESKITSNRRKIDLIDQTILDLDKQISALKQ